METMYIGNLFAVNKKFQLFESNLYSCIDMFILYMILVKV